VSFGLVGLGPGSAADFSARKPFPAPTEAEPERTAPPPQERFDVAAVNLVLHHVDDIKGFMEGVRGVLKPGGVVVITEFTLAEDGTDVVAKNRAMKEQKEHVSLGGWVVRGAGDRGVGSGGGGARESRADDRTPPPRPPAPSTRRVTTTTPSPSSRSRSSSTTSGSRMSGLRAGRCCLCLGPTSSPCRACTLTALRLEEREKECPRDSRICSMTM
jgi:hypothetical protein